MAPEANGAKKFPMMKACWPTCPRAAEKSSSTPREKPVPVEKEWTNREGQKIVATLLGVEGDLAILRMKNGTVHRYPIAKLSDASQAEIKGERQMAE